MEQQAKIQALLDKLKNLKPDALEVEPILSEIDKNLKELNDEERKPFMKQLSIIFNRK